jgi:hypothetical protein
MVFFSVSLFYFNYILPNNKKQNLLIKRNIVLEKSLVESNTKLFLCKTKKKTLIFESEMKGAGNEINDINYSFDNKFTF